MTRHDPRIRSLTLIFTLTLGALPLIGCDRAEQAAVTSPLVGAAPIEERGLAEVLETRGTGRYTYLRLDGAPTGTWHVVMGARPAPGERVAWRGYAELRDFHSGSLGETFPRLVFSSIER